MVATLTHYCNNELAIFNVKESREEEGPLKEAKAIEEKQPGYKNAWVKKSVKRPRSLSGHQRI